MSNSDKAYKRKPSRLCRAQLLPMYRPAAHDPRPSPTMNVERTMETSAVVTENRAIAKRSQTTS